ncbi:DUF6916 family protein [Cucumibacter marinus]|uniref:DUF6916 family protein n=1 Tax=Cucumibacter marinus TaxID=1121252 RepID=UPI0003FC48C8
MTCAIAPNAPAYAKYLEARAMFDPLNASASDFEGLGDKSFTVTSVEPEVPLELIEVKAMGSGMREGGAFSLLWRGPNEPALPQATYRVTQAELGEIDLFLVPVAQFEDGFRYEAVFA